MQRINRIDAFVYYSLWHPWDASCPTLKTAGTKYIWSPPTFETGRLWLFGQRGQPRCKFPANLIAVLNGGEREVAKGMGETGRAGFQGEAN